VSTVGVVGLGAMGKPIAERLAKAGYTVLGCDPHATATGVHMVTNAAADFVFVVVPTDADVIKAVTTLLDAGRTNMTIAISSSVHPETCRRLATRAEKQGVEILDVALTGGIRGARNGTLNLLIGGNPEAANQAADIFHTIATNYHLLGPVGAGQVAKAASNLIHWAEIAAITEAFTLASAYGVSPADLRQALQHGGTDSRTLRELELMHFTWYAKDIEVAQDMATAANLELPVAQLARNLMDHISPESIRELLSKD
jgi:3-hydroxyisobutyrate dehydrogenase-like beta-hydroxyacid dehydrogenase